MKNEKKKDKIIISKFNIASSAIHSEREVELERGKDTMVFFFRNKKTTKTIISLLKSFGQVEKNKKQEPKLA